MIQNSQSAAGIKITSKPKKRNIMHDFLSADHPIHQVDISFNNSTEKIN